MQAEARFDQPRIVHAHIRPTLELVEVFATFIEPALGGDIIRKLGIEAPLPTLQHAKRVRKSRERPDRLELLLWPVPAGALPIEVETAEGASEPALPLPDQLLGQLPPAVREVVRTHTLQLHTVKVHISYPL